MPIDLKEVLKKKLAPKSSGETFQFQTVGDQLVFRFKGRRTVTTKRGEGAEIVDCQALGGEKVDPETKEITPVKPGDCSFFLSKVLRRIFDEEKPQPGDTLHVQLVELVPAKNDMKLYGVEFLDRAAPVAKTGKGGDINDDIQF